jgi:hypothetical protein
MSSALKWAVMKIGQAVARNVSSLYYQLVYREMFREINSLTKSEDDAVESAYNLGYFAALESAERQKPVFRLFPSQPEKILGYMPLIWQINFGMPMGEYKVEWDRSDPERPICKYRISNFPLMFDYGKDPERDNLPLDKFNFNNNGYGAIMTGMLTTAVSFILKIKGSNKCIIVKNSEDISRGDPYFTLHCQILPVEEMPSFNLEGIKTEEAGLDSGENPEDVDGEQELSRSDNIWAKITEKISIDQVDEILSTPTGYIQVILKKLIEDALHMKPDDAFDHFTNYEREFIKILGFLSVHLFNELGQLPQKIFETEKIAKVYGHLFNSVRNNAQKILPISIIGDLKSFMIEVITGVAPEEFIQSFSEILDVEMLNLFFDGAQKALQDLGINFIGLKKSLMMEFQSEKSPEPIAENQEKENKINRTMLFEKLFNEFVVSSSALLSIPGQLGLILVFNAFSGSNEIFSSVFTTVRDSSQQIIEIVEKLNEEK